MADYKGEGSAATSSGTTLSDLKSICYYHGWHDTSTTGKAALTRFINRTLQLLALLAPWPEYHKRDGRITLADGTSNYVCTDDSDNTISNIAHIGPVITPSRITPLQQIDLEDWLAKTKASSTSALNGFQYALRRYVSDSGDTAGQVLMEILLWPTPSATGYLYYTYWKYPKTLSDDSDLTDWPDYRLWLLEEALERRISSGSRDATGAALESADFIALVQKAIGESRVSYMPRLIEQPVSRRNLSIKEIPIAVE